MQREPYSKVFDYTCSHSGIYDGMQAGQWCLSCNCIHSVVCARRLESIASCGSICILFFSWVCGYVTSCVYFSVDNFRFCRWTTAALVLLVIHICARCLRTDGTHRCLLHAPLPAATSYRQLSIHLQVLERSVQLALLLPFCPVKCMFMYSVLLIGGSSWTSGFGGTWTTKTLYIFADIHNTRSLFNLLWQYCDGFLYDSVTNAYVYDVLSWRCGR